MLYEHDMCSDISWLDNVIAWNGLLSRLFSTLACASISSQKRLLFTYREWLDLAY
jgi:hypothetical protein